MKRSIKIVALLLLFGSIAYVSYHKLYSRDAVACDAGDIPSNDPAHVVVDVLNSLRVGKIDNTRIVYGEKQRPLHLLNSGRGNFPGVRFPVEDIKVSPYNPSTKSVSYSCRVPHPAVVLWQYYAEIEPGKLSHIPKGFETFGKFSLVGDKRSGFRVRVTNDTNPISLYNKVVSNVLMWHARQSRTPTPDVIRFHVYMLVAAYAIALNIPEQEKDAFLTKVLNEFNAVHPK